MPRTNIDIYARLHGAEGKIENLEDKLYKLQGRAKSSGNSLRGLWKQVAAGMGLTMGIPALARGIGKLASSFLSVSTQIERYEIRLKTLLGSQEAANVAMDDFQAIASKLPYTLDEVIESGIRLTTIKVPFKDWLIPIADVAAAFGLDLPTATDQFSRAMSAGLGAADWFREKGISAMIRDFAKLKYGIDDISKAGTAKLKEVMFEWAKTFEGSSEDMSKTWDGMVSMLQDLWFKFRDAIMEAGIFENLKAGLESLLEGVRAFEAAGGFEDVALQVSATSEAVSTFVAWQKKKIQNVKDFISLSKDMIKGIIGEKEETEDSLTVEEKLHAALVRLNKERGKELLALQEKKPLYAEIISLTELEKTNIEELFTVYDVWGQKINYLTELRKGLGVVEQEAFQEVLPAAKNVWGILKWTGEAYKDYGKNAVVYGKDIVKSTEEQIGIFTSLAGAMQSGITGIMNVLKQWVIGEILLALAKSKLPFLAKLGLLIPSIAAVELAFGSIAKLQKGGVAMGEMVAEIGHGRGEAIIPLERLPQIVREISTETTITKMREMQFYQTIQIGTERIADEVVTMIQDRAERGTFVLPLKVIQ